MFEEGRYYLEVSANLPGNTGTHTLDTRLRGFDDNPDDDMSSDTQSGVEAFDRVDQHRGEIEVAGDSDWIKVTLEAGRVYVLDVLANGDGTGGTLEIPRMRLINANGEEIAVDDNSEQDLTHASNLPPLRQVTSTLRWVAEGLQQGLIRFG